LTYSKHIGPSLLSVRMSTECVSSHYAVMSNSLHI